MQVTCPCCKGEKQLLMVDENTQVVYPMRCCHCDGKGKVDAEISEHESEA
jgi:hypothetical protein